MTTGNRFGLVSATAVVTLIGSFTAPEVFGKESVERPFHQSLAGGGIGKITVETTSGDITVTGGDRDSVLIDAEIYVVGKKQEVCDKLAGEVEIEVKEHGGELSISADYPKKHGYDISISFTLAVPTAVGLEASSVNGALNVTNLAGGAELSAINGQVTVREVAGAIDASTINGLISLSDVTGEVEASTINGAVNCVNTAVCPAGVDFNSINGPLQLTLPSSPDAGIEAETMSGSVALNGVVGVELKGNPKAWSGSLGSGKGHYEFSAINGSITITVKTEPK
jgi:DUF4097 and DUF4098 domain-containing protein YvlB